MRVLIKGAGDLATGTAWLLKKMGYQVLCTETARPTAVRRAVSFCQAVYDGVHAVEGRTAVLCHSAEEAVIRMESDQIPILIDPECRCLPVIQPDILIDAILAKKNLGTKRTDAPLVIALGPGFTAGVDCTCVVETMRGDSLGNVIWKGSAIPNTGIPGEVAGYTAERLLKAPACGRFRARAEIGDLVCRGDIVAEVGGEAVRAQISGCLRGLLQDGLRVTAGMKIGDIDARPDQELCFHISDKARKIAEGCLQAIRENKKRFPCE